MDAWRFISHWRSCDWRVATMSEKKRIACFFTAGYTELYAMKTFMKKINTNCEYIQLCPTTERKNKNDIKNRHAVGTQKRHTESIAQSGYTGDKLIEFVHNFIRTDKYKREKYDAILIEDDKDNRFLTMLPDGSGRMNSKEWAEYKKTITDHINALYPELPVLFFLAAPEVETWLITDWENGVGSMFKRELGADTNRYFNIVFRKYVNDEILKDYKESIEEYGYFSGQYQKLSEKLQEALKEGNYWNNRYDAAEYKLSYSKKIQGGNALEQIEPDIVKNKCTLFFRDAFYQLQNI